MARETELSPIDRQQDFTEQLRMSLAEEQPLRLGTKMGSDLEDYITN